MVGIGFSEMLIIAGIALVLLGPEKFPEFAKMAIRAWRDLQKYMDEMKTEIAKEVKPLERELREVARKTEEVYKEALEEVESEDSSYTSYTTKGYSSNQYLEHSVTTYPENQSISRTSEGIDTAEESTFEPYDPDVPQADLKRGTATYPHSDEEIYENTEDEFPEGNTAESQKELEQEKNKEGNPENEEEIEYPEKLDG